MRLVLFDCDGTLVDSQATQIETMRRTMADMDIPVPPVGEIRGLIGVSLEQTFAILLDRPIDAGIHAIVGRFKGHYQQVVTEVTDHSLPYDGISTLLELLSVRDDLLLGVVTGKSRRGLDGLFEKEGWHPHFFTTRTADDCPSKPHPAMVLECCGDAGIDPARTLVVGDTSFDMEMAVAAGATAYGVDWGYHPPHHLAAAGAEMVLNRPEELLDVLGGNR